MMAISLGPDLLGCILGSLFRRVNTYDALVINSGGHEYEDSHAWPIYLSSCTLSGMLTFLQIVLTVHLCPFGQRRYQGVDDTALISRIGSVGSNSSGSQCRRKSLKL